ncbi:MAG: hypothetical protein JW940_12595 [Polyangiaceae bacterium]|nr:hypothetical protein [Polyangiaceae bacterium]
MRSNISDDDHSVSPPQQGGAAECSRYFILLRPALLDQADHRVCLAHPVSNDVVSQREPANRHCTAPLSRLNATPIVDDDIAAVSTAFFVLEKAALLGRGGHGPKHAPAPEETGQVWVRTPTPPLLNDPAGLRGVGQEVWILSQPGDA